jgi:Thiolase, C-terminal domain
MIHPRTRILAVMCNLKCTITFLCDTGTRLVVTLLHYLKRTGKRYGVVSLCIGTGMGAAAVYENPHYSKDDIPNSKSFQLSKL